MGRTRGAGEFTREETSLSLENSERNSTRVVFVEPMQIESKDWLARIPLSIKDAIVLLPNKYYQVDAHIYGTQSSQRGFSSETYQIGRAHV